VSEQVRVPIAEEEVTVDKRRRTTGKVTIVTSTEVVDTPAAVNLERHDVTVERMPIGREVDEASVIREEGSTTIIPVLEEVLVIEKRLVLKEEIRLTRSTVTEHFETPVTLRKQVATVKRIAATNPDQGEDQ
jgi:stress response protein YsnF